MSNAVERFLATYAQMRDFYDRAAFTCHEQCRDVLAQNGIMQLVTYRAKRGDRLGDKLKQRENEGRLYPSEDDITNEIRDLAGVRIALYFPGDRPEATRLLCDQFKVIGTPKEFNGSEERRGADIYHHRFPGYEATHLTVHLRPDTLAENTAHLAKARIEIQIASLVMHAWAEVEHDLVYKPFKGELSEAEYALLDQVNGLAYSGEIALEQLQAAMRQRLARGQQPFRNPYELAAYIHTALTLPDASTFHMGRADLLLRLLREAKLDRPDSMMAALELMGTTDPERPLVDQIAARVIDSVRDEQVRSRIAQTWRNLREVEILETKEAWREARERFEARWRNVERALRQVLARVDPDGHSRSWLDIAALGRIPRLGKDRAETVRRSQELFISLSMKGHVHSAEELTERAEQLGAILEWVYSEHPGIEA